MQSNNMIDEKTKQTVTVYTNVCQTRLNNLGKLVATSLVAPSSLARATSDGPPTTEPKASGCGSGVYASSAFEYQLTSIVRFRHSTLVIQS